MIEPVNSNSIRDLLSQGGEAVAKTGSARGAAAILFSPFREEAEIVFRDGLSLEVCGALASASGRTLLSWARRTPSEHLLRREGLANRAPELHEALTEEGLGGLALSPLLGEESVLGYIVVGLPPELGRGLSVESRDLAVWERVSQQLEDLRGEAGRAILRYLLTLQTGGGVRGVQALLVLDREDRILFAHGVSRLIPSWGRGEVTGQPVKALPGGTVLAGMEVPGTGHVDWRIRKVSAGDRKIPLSLAAASLWPFGESSAPWKAILIRGPTERDAAEDGILLELAMRVSQFKKGSGPGRDNEGDCADSLNLAKGALAAEEQAHEEEAIDLSGLFRGFLHRLEPELRDDRIRVLPFLGGNLPAVRGGRRHLETALWAVLRRSWASLLPRGGTITLRTWEEDGSVWCSIADDGQGIEDGPALETLSLEPLRELEEGRELPDSGIDLARDLIRAGGGSFHVEVRPQLWTRYSVVFPVARVVDKGIGKPASALPPAVEVHRARNGTLEVLVVDDNEMVRTVLRKYLERKGHEVTEAVDGGVALEILRDRGFDHVMVDIDMPGTTGIEFFQQLDSVAPQMRERTVFMTGGFQEGAAEDFIQGTGRPHIQKPFDLKEIAEILQA